MHSANYIDAHRAVGRVHSSVEKEKGGEGRGEEGAVRVFGRGWVCGKGVFPHGHYKDS